MSKIFSLIGAGIGLLVGVKALLSKSELEQAFLTQEQLIKLGLYRLISLSAFIGVLAADLYFMWSLMFRGKKYETTDWNYVLGLGIAWFIFGLMFVSMFTTIIVPVFAKYHFKYKVHIPGTGDVYIHKMMNPEVCICSKDPHQDINQDDSETYLFSFSDIQKLPIIKKKFQRPQTKIQRFLKYNSPEPVNTNTVS
ncbi:hypothetical protein M3226_30660 [Neobacillus cucumis]|uniref:hypothetical protein n=1 Tax=Neobacillus cucumis TaxID=1740721 RepID=UPI002042312C|nr:hypothetical protein [Neobacillus cucumis]MCM3729888.1 hypothetical protein [Neobacillus cucumis]